MSSTNIEPFLPQELAKAIANPLFPELDSALRSGRHIGKEDLDNHAFLLDFEEALQHFYQRYHAELIRAPEGFYYLRPKSTSYIGKSVLSELDMLVGKVLCFLYLSPERLAQEGIFSYQELYEELVSLADESKLLKLINLKASGSNLDREKLQDKVKTSLRRLKRLGMIIPVGEQGKFRVSEASFRFGAEVRTTENMRDAQLRLIRDGEAIVHHEPHIQTNLFEQAETSTQSNEEQVIKRETQ